MGARCVHAVCGQPEVTWETTVTPNSAPPNTEGTNLHVACVVIVSLSGLCVVCLHSVKTTPIGKYYLTLIMEKILKKQHILQLRLDCGETINALKVARTNTADKVKKKNGKTRRNEKRLVVESAVLYKQQFICVSIR